MTTSNSPAGSYSVDFDVVVVGAGPAGSCAAIEAARAGRRVALIERGPFPGAKNMYGGVVYPRILDDLIPQWWEHAPVQRWVTRRSTMILAAERALTLDLRSEAWGRPPYNGATAFRPEFDAWLASVAEAAGVTLVCSTTVTGLLRDASGAVIGVRTDRPDGDLSARVVIACDGVNSFCAKEAGLHVGDDASHYTLGVKETLRLPRDVIEARFGVRERDGVDIEILGGTSGVPGGGFVYTNLESLSVGVVLKLPALSAQQRRPEEILAGLKAHPAIAPLVEGGEVAEYSAHLIPEAGWSMMPKLTGPGLIIAGDAAAMCLAAGIWLEGVNFAMGSGRVAGRVAARAISRGDVSESGLAPYREELESTFVLADHRRLRRVPELVLSSRVQQQYPDLVTGIVEGLFQVENPTPKPGLRRIVTRERRRAGVRWRDLARDAWTGLRSFG